MRDKDGGKGWFGRVIGYDFRKREGGRQILRQIDRSIDIQIKVKPLIL